MMQDEQTVASASAAHHTSTNWLQQMFVASGAKNGRMVTRFLRLIDVGILRQVGRDFSSVTLRPSERIPPGASWAAWAYHLELFSYSYAFLRSTNTKGHDDDDNEKSKGELNDSVGLHDGV